MKKKEFKNRCEFVLNAFRAGNINLKEGSDFLVSIFSSAKERASWWWFMIGIVIGSLISKYNEILKIFY